MEESFHQIVQGLCQPRSIAVKGINYTIKACEKFADYHRLLAPGGRYEDTCQIDGPTTS
ncbi:hypothetical protein LguiA_021851 [Lonicera macranthoides]